MNESGSSKPAVSEEKKAADEKKEHKKLTLGQKFKKEVHHYWDGTKLLATEVRISTRLGLKMAAGYELSRRESRQVGSIEISTTHMSYGRLILFRMSSFEELLRTWVDWSRFRCLFLFPLRNCCFRLP